MKKFLILALMLFLMPFTVKAEEYDVKSANMKITFPNEWYVFTRENVEDNKDLENLKIDADYMNKFFNANSAYIDAIKSNLEFVLRTTDNVDYESLSDYPEAKINEIAQDMGAINKTDDYKVYANKYKYVLLNSKSGDYYITIYATVINSRWYTFTIQKKSAFTSEEATEIKKIIDSIDYTIIEKPAVETTETVETIEKDVKESNKENRFELIRIYVATAIIAVIFIGFLVSKKKGKNEKI